MSVIDDTRKVMQDFLAPELRGISARIEALEQRFGTVDKRFDGVDHRFDRVDQRLVGLDRKFDEVERRAEKRHDEVLAAIAKMSDITELRERLTRLESRDSAHQ
jgi:hypothetical protein